MKKNDANNFIISHKLNIPIVKSTLNLKQKAKLFVGATGLRCVFCSVYGLFCVLYWYYYSVKLLSKLFKNFWAKNFRKKAKKKRTKNSLQMIAGELGVCGDLVSSFETAAISLKPTVIWSLELSELLTLAVHFGRGSVFSLFYLQSFHFRHSKAYFFSGPIFCF